MNVGLNEPLRVDVRPPSVTEFHACRTLVSEANHWVRPPAYLAALAEGPEHLVGGLAYTPIFDPGGPAWLVLLRVIPTQRRRAIATALLDALAAKARDQGIGSLVARVTSASTPEAPPFLQARGFELSATMTTFETDLDRLEAVFGRVFDRLKARGTMPAGGRLVPLTEVPLEQVARLYTEHLGGTTESVVQALRRGTFRGGTCVSVVLMVGDQARGVILNEAHGEIATVHAKILDPEYRGGAAGALLDLESVRRGRLLGVRRIRYAAAEHVRYTFKYAARCSAEVVRVTSEFVRLIPGPGPGRS